MSAAPRGNPRVAAWCGLCGYDFDLAQLVAAGGAGVCPRCGQRLVGEYAATAVNAASTVLGAVGDLHAAASTLAAVAPHLHVDTAALAAALGEAFGGPKG